MRDSIISFIIVGILAISSCGNPSSNSKKAVPAPVQKPDYSSITELTIPAKQTRIGSSDYDEYINLQIVTIPESVQTISSGAFSKCRKIEKFVGKFASPDGRCLIYNNELISFAPSGITEYTIPEGVKTIGLSAFEDCKDLVKIVLPKSLKTIGKYAFNRCSSLKIAALPNNLEEIDRSAFYGCSSLQTMTFPKKLESIRPYAFCDCKSLTTIKFLEGGDILTYIYEGAFQDCTSLKSVYLERRDILFTLANAFVSGKDTHFKNNAPGRKFYVKYAVPSDDPLRVQYGSAIVRR